MEPMKRSFARRLASAGGALAMVAGTFAGLGATLALTATPAAAATAVCNATITGGGSVVPSAGGNILVGVVAGTSAVTIDCNSSASPAITAEASLVGGIVSGTESATSYADLTTAQITGGWTTSGGTGCPAGTSCLQTTYTIPATYSATSPAACAPTQSQVNDGLFGCVLAVATGTQTVVTEIPMTFSGQPTPAAPTIAAATATGVSGNTITLSDASSPTGFWWADAIQAVQATVLGTTPTAEPTSCAAPAYGTVPPTPFLAVQWVPTGGGTAVAGSAAGVSITNDCMDASGVHGPVLSGTTTVPSGLTPGSTYNVFVCELNGLAGLGAGWGSNDANVSTDCPAAPVTGATWIDASFTYTVEAAAAGSASPSSGGVGTSVSVTASGLDPQGTPVYAAFTTGSNTPGVIDTVDNAGPTVSGSTGTCGAVTAAGNVTCSISVTSVDTIGSNPIVLYQFDAGPTTTLNVPFNVTAISTTCTVTAPATSCSIQQVITLTVNPGTLSISETSPNVTLSAITLNGTAQSATGNLNQVVVNDSRGTLVGWSLVGQFQGNFQNATSTGPTADNTITVANTAGTPGETGFNWTPAVTASTSLATEIAAGGATTNGLSTTAPTTLCTGGGEAGGNGGGGGITDCNAAVTLGVPATIAAGTYSATLNLTIS